MKHAKLIKSLSISAIITAIMGILPYFLGKFQEILFGWCFFCSPIENNTYFIDYYGSGLIISVGISCLFLIFIVVHECVKEEEDEN